MDRQAERIGAQNSSHDDNFNHDGVDPQSGRPSTDSSTTAHDIQKTHHKGYDEPMTEKKTPITATTTPPQPSVRLLFSLVSQRDVILFLLPATAAAIIAGSVAPFMTFVVGQAFNAFSNFPLNDPSAEDKAKLRHDVGFAAIELIALAAATLSLSSMTSALWVTVGERNVMRLRQKVYDAISRHDMQWFDKGMGTDSGSEDSVGAGGLMAKFVRDTDEVRMATSLASGMLVQYLTTCITCLVLAFQRSWALTLVILSAVPILVIIQGFSQRFAGPLINIERDLTGVAATLVERAVSAIATVKAFNAQSSESSALSNVLGRTAVSSSKLNAVFGLTSALSQFVTMAMFVQGFWFGSLLVRRGTVNPGDVMTVFWACLIATSNLQMCIPHFITLAKGKFAMVSLLTLSGSGNDEPPPPYQIIKPMRCRGDFALNHVTFAYPSRPHDLVLRGISIYFPSNEVTFVVGGSGSGKSTIAQLLARIYVPQGGRIDLDDRELLSLDEAWLRSRVALVSQTCILFDGTVHDNVAIGVAGSGLDPKDVPNKDVVKACTAALMHEFIRDLPEGYDTVLGNGGTNLSGGQRQRLAIARAILRDPDVLILDEATSALDVTSRVLVFEAIKALRANKTTIVITHDLSQITRGDFVYVLKDGIVAEQGYRQDLENSYDIEKGEGEFRKMMRMQGETGGLPIKEERIIVKKPSKVSLMSNGDSWGRKSSRSAYGIASMRASVSLSDWMIDVVRDFSKRNTVASNFLSPFTNQEQNNRLLVPSIAISRSSVYSQTEWMSVYDARRGTLVPSPTSKMHRVPSHMTLVKDDEEFEKEKSTMERSGAEATRRRVQRTNTIRTWHSDNEWETIAIDNSISANGTPTNDRPRMSLLQLIREVYPTVSQKPFIALGLVMCIASGAMTPVFSFLLSRLLFEVSIGAKDISTINIFGGIVLGIAAIDGILMGLKFFIMETGALSWVNSLRKRCYALVLAQDKKYFDKTENSPVALMQVLIKDGDDARNLIAVVLGQFVVVVAMLSVGLIWAIVTGWQLTLAGLAIGPIFVFAMGIQSSVASRFEHRNKVAREVVAKGFYECVANIRAIRCMAFESTFRQKFDTSVALAYRAGIRGAFVEGSSYGVASSLIYLAEALLFYVGAVLMANGTYTYLRMVQVLNLVVFTVTIGSQLMSFAQRIAKATEATRDFLRLKQLDLYTDESKGDTKPAIEGDIRFRHVSFSYPERPDVPVLRNTSFKVTANECVAVVGASGCGKSTVVSLLQRLYQPNSGKITINSHDICAMDTTHLREYVSVVGQNPMLFDATIAENIAYGNDRTLLSTHDIRRAAKAAQVHDFIMSLPQGYDTMVGENAALISGGQAQRLAIARALARPAKILVLDECTSALDPENQRLVMTSIARARKGRSTIVVTHKLPVMRMCDRIIVLHEGAVAEDGTYERLMKRNGIFASLARGGEWTG